MVGEVLADRYELEELVGTGGMSSVFRAHDRLLDRTVALKVLHEQYSEDEEYVERFRREARSVAALSHPNIVTVIDRGEHERRQFIVFEYVDGENLKRLVERRGELDLQNALELALQIARGLSFAHGMGLVHRDVKPQNVLLNGDGQAKVTDFGIARSLDVQHGMTQTGAVLGTSDYIAPEQAQGQTVSEQTDVYSLGVVLYELLTSQVPFHGENFVSVAMRHINEPPPRVSDRRRDVPPRVDAAVERAMAKDPEDRFASMDDFCAELETCLAELRGGGGTVVLPPQSRRGKRPQRARPARRGISPWPFVLVLLGLIAVGAVVAVALLHGNGDGGGGGTTAAGGGGVPHLTGIGAYDPFGDGTEHDADASNATDRDPATYWTTERYFSGLAGAGKSGVGLVLDAGRSVQLGQLGIATDTPGYRAVIRASSSPTSGFSPVSASQTVGSRTQFSITRGPYRYYLIWITNLGPGYDVAHVNAVSAS